MTDRKKRTISSEERVELLGDHLSEADKEKVKVLLDRQLNLVKELYLVEQEIASFNFPNMSYLKEGLEVHSLEEAN